MSAMSAEVAKAPRKEAMLWTTMIWVLFARACCRTMSRVKL